MKQKLFIFTVAALMVAILCLTLWGWGRMGPGFDDAPGAERSLP